jgi:hypothetical protein
MRLPENLSATRAAVSTKDNWKKFYDCVTDVVERHGLTNKPHLLRILSDAGISYITEVSSFVSQGMLGGYGSVAERKLVLVRRTLKN